MRTILVAVLAAVVLAACGNNPRKTATSDPQSDGVEVLCFHGAKRCVTCTATDPVRENWMQDNFVCWPSVYPC